VVANGPAGRGTDPDRQVVEPSGGGADVVIEERHGAYRTSRQLTPAVTPGARCEILPVDKALLAVNLLQTTASTGYLLQQAQESPGHVMRSHSSRRAVAVVIAGLPQGCRLRRSRSAVAARPVAAVRAAWRRRWRARPPGGASVRRGPCRSARAASAHRSGGGLRRRRSLLLRPAMRLRWGYYRAPYWPVGVSVGFAFNAGFGWCGGVRCQLRLSGLLRLSRVPRLSEVYECGFSVRLPGYGAYRPWRRAHSVAAASG
jgi:hypothetical protein